MAKVRCKFCKFEQQRKCMKKNHANVGLNKKRVCSTYVIDAEKVGAWADRKQISSKPEVTLRPDWLWSRKERREVRDKINKEALAKYQATIDEAPQQVSTTTVPSHPVTGDLGRFLESTVEKSNE